MSADRVRWEHIQHVYEAYGRNVSEAARRLGMHGAPYSGFFPNVHCMELSASNLVRRSGPARPG